MALLHEGLFGLAGMFPSKYMNSILTGQVHCHDGIWIILNTFPSWNKVRFYRSIHYRLSKLKLILNVFIRAHEKKLEIQSLARYEIVPIIIVKFVDYHIYIAWTWRINSLSFKFCLKGLGGVFAAIINLLLLALVDDDVNAAFYCFLLSVIFLTGSAISFLCMSKTAIFKHYTTLSTPQRTDVRRAVYSVIT